MTNSDVVWIGPCPADENAAQSVNPDFHAKNRAECLSFIQALKKHFGEPPEGARFVIKRQDHDFSSYKEVAIEVDSNNEAAVEWAYMVEEKAPTTWAEYGVEAPNKSNGRSR